MAILTNPDLRNEIEPPIALVGRPPQEVIDQLTSGVVRITRRVEIYESDAVTPFDIPYWDKRLITGTINIDRDRDERRSIDVLLDNDDGALINDPYDGFWYDKVLKAFWGIRYYSESLGEWTKWETPAGEFMIDQLNEDRFPNAVKVTGRDFTKKCIVSKLQYGMSFATGNTVETIIRALAANAGITKFALPYTDQAYDRDLTFTRGTARWEVMKQIADSAGYEIFFQGDGYLTMRPYPDPTTHPLAWSFNQDEGGTLVDYKRSSNDSRVFNHIIVTGTSQGAEPQEQVSGGSQSGYGNINTEIVFAEAKNEDEGSPTRISRIGDRVAPPIESDLFVSQQQAQDYADTQLRISSLEEYQIGFQSLMIPWLEGSDIVEIVEKDRSEFTPTRFLLSNFTIPLGLGGMSGTARRVTIVGSNQSQEYQ